MYILRHYREDGEADRERWSMGREERGHIWFREKRGSWGGLLGGRLRGA
jgi:hypothetical protein